MLSFRRTGKSSTKSYIASPANRPSITSSLPYADTLYQIRHGIIQQLPTQLPSTSTCSALHPSTTADCLRPSRTGIGHVGLLSPRANAPVQRSSFVSPSSVLRGRAMRWSPYFGTQRLVWYNWRSRTTIQRNARTRCRSAHGSAPGCGGTASGSSSFVGLCFRNLVTVNTSWIAACIFELGPRIPTTAIASAVLARQSVWQNEMDPSPYLG
jgi:hypothetical protein